ncbi:ROK family protein [Pedobacter sp. PWIIR3]
MFNTNKKNSKLYAQIIQQLYYGKIMSCAELSLKTAKSIPLVTKSLNHLMELGLVIEKGHAPSSGGRRPLMYAVKSDRLFVVAVAMDQLSTKIVTVDLLNNYTSPVSIFDLDLRNNADALNALITIIKDHVDHQNIDKKKLVGIGIGMPGFINVNEGINYTYLSSGKKSIPDSISEATGLPVFIDNDSSLIALSELKFGIARSIKDVMVVNLSWGIGLGMIINGELFRGHAGFAGEVSHIPIAEDGALCSCGKQGCLEAEASLLAVSEIARNGVRSGRISSFQHYTEKSDLDAGNALMELALKGDPFAVELLSEAGYKIGRALSILIHLMNPKVIVISGRGVKVGKLILAPIQQALNKYCIPRLASETEILISEIGLDAELVGAAILVIENFPTGK